MFHLSRSWMFVIAAGLAIACSACQQKTKEKPAEQRSAAVQKEPVAMANDAGTSEEPASQQVVKHEHKPAAHKPKPQQPPPPPPTIPKVALSSEIRATCLVNVGDALPEAELPDPTGKMHALKSLYGQKLTVVCLWTIGTTRRSQLVSAAVLEDLVKGVLEPFGPKGVGVIGISVGDPAAVVQQETAKAGATFPNLLDPKGEYFAKIAKDKRMPRTFLLDAAGRVLWFDVEYSRSSRRDLVQSIRVALGEL
jgi:peroxiredoxin